MLLDARGGLMPRVIPWSPNFPLDVVMAQLSSVKKHAIVTITGGCAEMSDEDASGVLELFREAFQDFEGAMLIGGTRTIHGKEPDNVLFGITEVGPAIRRANPNSFVLGVVPRCEDFGFDSEVPILVVRQQESISSSDPNGSQRDFTTIVHPDQDLVVAVTTPLTKLEIWDDEVEFRRYVTHTLVTYGNWQPLLVAYNGGSVTEREIRAWAAQGWPVLIVQGSGRKCDILASDAEFLRHHPSVMVCDRSASSMRAALQGLDIVRPTVKHSHLKVVG